MKIAVCLSGQIRGGLQTIENHKNFLGPYLKDTDFFIHTWNLESTISQHEAMLRGQSVNLTYVPDSKIEQLYNEYKPQVIRIDNYYTAIEEFKNEYKHVYSREYSDPSSSRYGVGLNPQFLSFNIVTNLRNIYEHLHRPYYDLVIKLRFDMAFTNQTLESELEYMTDLHNTMYFADPHNIHPLGRTEDVYWMGDAFTMNTMGDFIYHIPDYQSTKEGDWMNDITDYLKDREILTKPMKNNLFYIYR